MTQLIAAGVAEGGHGPASFAQAASAAAAGLGEAPVDLAAVFVGAGSLPDVEAGLAAVRDVLPARTLIGCGAQGVVGAGRELEQGGVAVWAASLPGARLDAFRLDTVPAGESAVAVSGLPDLDEADAVILLVDPYSFPIEPLLVQLGEAYPGLPIVGGLTSAGGGGMAALVRDDEVLGDGAVGIALGGVDVHPCVSQGARPIGPEMVITAAEANVIHELASQPALTRLKQGIADLTLEERMLAAHGLLLGIVLDENKPEYGRGDFLIRGLVGIDEEEDSVIVGEQVRVGQTVRMQVRDAASADEDLGIALGAKRAELAGRAAGALLFTCNGRGSHMFGVPDHDALALARALEGAPAAGFFCAGEIGPVGARSFVHGFTATVAIFGPGSPG